MGRLTLTSFVSVVRANLRWMICVLSLLYGQVLIAQSFDCAKASTKVEIAICKSDDLKRIDAGMGEAYKALLGVSSEPNKSAVVDAQKLWIEKRNQQCAASPAERLQKCLMETIARRTDELTAQLRAQMKLSPMAYAWIQNYSNSSEGLAQKARDVQSQLGGCRQISPTPGANAASLAPKDYESLFSIATHRCDMVLRVLLGCPQANDFDSCKELLVLEEPANKQARIMGSEQEHTAANSAGIFVPIAFDKDDRYLILKAWMGSPGAGGGAIDYGYEMLPRERGAAAQAALAPAAAVFYDDFGKAVYTEDSDKLSKYSQPGPRSNDGLLVVKDLVTLKTRPVLEQRDTTFEILKADEKSWTLLLRFTHHTFSTSCPRMEQDSLHCSKKATQEGSIPLP